MMSMNDIAYLTSACSVHTCKLGSSVPHSHFKKKKKEKEKVRTEAMIFYVIVEASSVLCCVAIRLWGGCVSRMFGLLLHQEWRTKVSDRRKVRNQRSYFDVLMEERPWQRGTSCPGRKKKQQKYNMSVTRGNRCQNIPQIQWAEVQARKQPVIEQFDPVGWI